MAEKAEKAENSLVQRRREEILAAAKSVFARKGYRRTTIDEIAERLAVGKGTVYRYFADKKSLFLAVYESGLESLKKTMVSQIDTSDFPPERTRVAVRTFIEFFYNNGELIEIMMHARSEFREEYIRSSQLLSRFYLGRIEENLQSGIDMGVFRSMDVVHTAEAIGAMMQGILDGYYVEQVPEISGMNSEKKKSLILNRAEAVAALILDGVMKTNESKIKKGGG